jgi:chromosome segregation ATPase
MLATVLERSTDDPLSASRDRLRDAIARVRQEQERLTSLEEAQTRAHDQLRDAEHALSDAESALQRVNRDEQSRLAYQFVNNGAVDDDPVADAKAIVTTAQAEVERLEKVETALASEVDRVQATLRTLRVTQYTIMTELVCGSNEYRSLIEAHTAAWQRLRTIKTALKTVSAGLHGQMPQALMDEALRAEPLEVRVGFPVDAVFVDAWVNALAALENDASAELPEN